MPKALIVEDNRMFREILEEVLTSEYPAMEIEISEDGEQLLAKTGEYSPDVIFMDIQLPQHNGLILTKKVKALYPHIPVIIITGYNSRDYREAAFQAGANFFLSKTDLKTSDIVEAIESLVQDQVSCPSGE